MEDTTPDNLATTELLYYSWPNTTIDPSGNSTYQYVISTSQVSFLVVMAILIIVFNITVLLVHHFTPALRVPMSVFLKSLAYADLWVGVNCALNIGVTYAGGWPYGLVTCKLVGYLLLVVVLVSIMSLTCISLERYAAIHNPLHYRTVVTYTRSRLCVIALWVASGIVFLPAFFNWGRAWETHGSCTLFWRYNISFGFFVIAIFIMPNLLVSATCYIRIIFMLVARQRWLRDAGTTAERQHERLMAKIGLAVMSAFYVTWLPYVAASFLRFLNLASISPSFYNSALYLGISNSFLNCIIYSISHKAFRDGLKSMVLRFCCCCFTSKGPGRKQSASASTRGTSSNDQSTSAAASIHINESGNIDLEIQQQEH